MKKNNAAIEPMRWKTGPMASTEAYGNNGVFSVKGPLGMSLTCIVSDGLGWDHISVEVEPPPVWINETTLKQRLPRWEEMQFIKELFFEDNETAIQYHPPKADYVNLHPYVLHLWRCQTEKMKLPPKIMV